MSYDPCLRSFDLPHLWPLNPDIEDATCIHCGKRRPDEPAQAAS